jgi:mono/diheme cytochrome c family protein
MILKVSPWAPIAIALGVAAHISPAGHAQGADPIDSAQAIVDGTCRRCHNDRARYGNMSLEGFQVATADDNPALAEKMVRKLRAGMMPPSGVRRPDEAELEGLAATLETRLDAAAAANPNPGRRSFQRLNRAEYERSIHDLLSLDVRAGDYLPLDTKSANFDNIADVQLPSATLMNGYLRAASEISRLAVGDPTASPIESTYKVTRWVSQREQVDGAPYGSRGGVSVVHTFRADGEYVFRVSFHHETTGELFGSARGALHTAERPEQIEISIDGERAALFDIDRWMHVSDPDGVNLRTDPIRVTAGPHRVSAVFIRQLEGPVQDLISPHEWSLSSTSIANAYGFTSLPHLRDLAIRGPLDPTGVSETPSRTRIFTCRPTESGDARPCAREIVERLGAVAYRRPLTDDNLDALIGLYDIGAVDGGFEQGVRMALEGILASPHFVFRFEGAPGDGVLDIGDTGGFAVSDLELASRLSFFLWATGPDAELIQLATENRLTEPGALERQVRRMLADPKAEALATRFAAQWLRLPDLEKMHPDVRTYPDFDEQLKRSMRRETELFFHHLVREDRSLFELLTADYSFINERLAKHYGIPGIAGTTFREVTFPEGEHRRGLLGNASVLTLTSHAGRTSPVLRGKWVMEVLLGNPPPPPPPNVSDFEDTAATEDGRLLSVRERMELHRSSPACSSCHRMMDPIGLALEHYDVTGARRIKDSGAPIDAAGELYDGTPVQSVADLRTALLSRPTPFVRTFTENLMAYALGRRLEYFDMPVVRNIVSAADAEGNRLSAFILGIVDSPPFQRKGGVIDSPATDVAGQP